MPPGIRGGQPPVCDYEGSDYQTAFWERGERRYEDAVEAIALRRLLPPRGKLLLEVGAGAGRNTPRYHNFERVVLLDFSLSQLQQAQERLGRGKHYVYVAADVYSLPFVPGLFDAATMIRALHHMVEPVAALGQIREVLQPGAVFILEYANKLNLKAIFRYLLGRQAWSPFDRAPVEFAELNFDFHPAAVRAWLRGLDFDVQRQLAVSHFRVAPLKRLVPLRLLVALDSLFQWTGALWQLTPSVFLKARAVGDTPIAPPDAFFRCPECGTALPEFEERAIECPNCRRKWEMRDGIYDFK